MSPQSDQIPRHGTMTRAGLDGFLAGISLRSAPPKDAVARVLAQDPAEINARALGLAQLALRLLPVGQLSPLQKAAYGRQNHSLLATLCGNIADALRLALGLGVDLEVAADELEKLVRKKGLYATFGLLGKQVQDGAMDQRAVVGAFSAFLIERTLAAIDRRYHSDKTTEAERGRLLDDFAPALLSLDEVLRRPAERRQELGELRADLQAQAAEASADAQLAETRLKLLQNLVVPREELFAAARRHLERTRPEALAAAAAPLPPAPGPRRLL